MRGCKLSCRPGMAGRYHQPECCYAMDPGSAAAVRDDGDQASSRASVGEVDCGTISKSDRDSSAYE